MHRLTFVFALLATLAAYVRASAYEDLHQLFKRDLEKTPYETLPNTNCAVPDTCASVGTPSECRCGPLLTICRAGNQFCWGSQTLTKSGNSCPSTPSDCTANLNGTSSCLCDDDTLLCIDGFRHYCYGSYTGSGAQAQVSISAMPSDGGAAAAASSSGDKAESSNGSNDESAASAMTVLTSTVGVAVFGTMLSLAL